MRVRLGNRLLSGALGLLGLVGCDVYNPSLLESASAAGSGATGGTGGLSSGGSGGGVSTGGTGGAATGGATTGGTGGATGGTGGDTGSVTYSLIDDMDDGDQRIELIDGRDGNWFVFDDGSEGTASPVANLMEVRPDDPANYAMHFTATGFTVWGAGVGANVNDPPDASPALAYDASIYDGISFLARVAEGTLTSIKVAISDVNSDQDGGVCDPASTCDDHHFDTVAIGTEWARYFVPFEDLNRNGSWGEPDGAVFDPTGVFNIQFQGRQDIDTDLWVDELSFYAGTPE